MFQLRHASLVVAMLFASGVTHADNLYVNNLTGNDRFNGRRPEIRSQSDGPVATIARAMEIATRTDSIVIANTGEPYRESLILSRPELSGTSAYPFVIEGNSATLRGAFPVPTEIWRHSSDGTYRYQPFRKGHYQLVVNGKVAEEVATPVGAPTPPALKPLQWCAHRGFVYFRIEPFKPEPDGRPNFITDYEFESAQLEVGVGLHNARNVVVRNLNVELFRLDGVAVTGNSRDVRLLNVRSTANGRAGLSVAGTSQVHIGGLELADNRVAEQLVTMKGRVMELPEAEVPPKPAARSWDLSSGRYVRILPPASQRDTTATAHGLAPERR
jgi:hypothetical protein